MWGKYRRNESYCVLSFHRAAPIGQNRSQTLKQRSAASLNDRYADREKLSLVDLEKVRLWAAEPISGRKIAIGLKRSEEIATNLANGPQKNKKKNNSGINSQELRNLRWEALQGQKYIVQLRIELQFPISILFK